MRVQRFVLLVVVLVVAAVAAACEGCRAPRTGTDAASAAPEKATARLFFVSDLAGALEPCGCVKDQLGGMDHFGALVTKGRDEAAATLTLAAGPTFFMNLDLPDDRRRQEEAKAQTIAHVLHDERLVTLAPGRNDFVDGAAMYEILRGEAASAPASSPSPGGVFTSTVDVGGLALAVLAAGPRPGVDGPTGGAASWDAAVKAAADDARAKGARAIVVLAAVGRGEAKRIADAVPDALAVVVGSASSTGEVNTPAPPPEHVGDVLIIETANHLQTTTVLDLYVRAGAGAGGSAKTGIVKFADATGIERQAKREELTSRIDELRARIATWETDKSIDKRDIDARKADVAKLEAERAALEATPAPPSGSFYRVTTREIRGDLGADPGVAAQMLAYYKQIDEDNKRELAGRVPAPAPKGTPGYVGLDQCASCHDDAVKVWRGTRHSHAYETLSSQFKEYNLDCVSCHVTGYDKPGGSTVTHVDDLKDVQCEVCHGPGSLHMVAPKKVAMPVPKPGADRCLDCHHPPHVHSFDAKAKMADILGPGHGKPL